MFLFSYTVDFCCLKIDLFLRRELNFYLKYFYFPYVLIVFASWISFWLDRMIFIRLYITTSLLFIVIADLLFRSTAIPVSYTTALDVWIDGCILFVFLALLQNVFVACKVKKHFKRTTNAINLYTGAPLAKQVIIAYIFVYFVCILMLCDVCVFTYRNVLPLFYSAY